MHPTFNDFWTQAAASLIGSLSAFVLSLALFYWTQRVRASQIEKRLALNTITEIETDISMLEEIKSQIDDLCSDIELEVDLSKLYVPMRFKDVIYNFIGRAYTDGLLRKIMTGVEISELNRVMNRNSNQTDDVNLFLLNGYRGDPGAIPPKQPTRTKAEVLKFYRGQKKQVDKDIEFFKRIKNRLDKVAQKKKFWQSNSVKQQA